MNLNSTKSVLEAVKKYMAEKYPDAPFQHASKVTIRYRDGDWVGDCSIDLKNGRRSVSHRYMEKHYPNSVADEVMVEIGNSDYGMKIATKENGYAVSLEQYQTMVVQSVKKAFGN